MVREVRIMNTRLKPRQRKILEALRELGGEASTWQIAIATGLNTNGIAQTLGVLSEVACLGGGKGGACRWGIIPTELFLF